jgi:hypothetical protein
MATDVSIQLGYKDSAWFTANAAIVLLAGQIVYLDDQSGNYKLGDGVTALSVLSFLGGGSQSLQDVINVDSTINGLLAQSNNNFTFITVTDSGIELNSDVDVYKNGEIVATLLDTDSKLPIETPQTTGVALTFVTDSVYGTIGTPETGNITFSSTGAKLGVTNLIIHNHSVAPTFAANMKKLSGSGGYVLSVVNYIYVTYINSTEVIYSINQRI